MHLKIRKSALLYLLLCSLLLAVPVWAEPLVVETEQELLDALSSTDVSEIAVSGDIVLTDRLTIDRSVTLTGTADDAALLVSSQDIDGDPYSQNMVYVIGDGTEVTLEDLSFGFQETLHWADVYFWSFIDVSDGADLTVRSCSFDGYVDDRYSLNAISVRNSTLDVEGSYFDDFELAAILLGSGTEDVQIVSSDFGEAPIGVLTAHDSLEAYASDESAIRDLNIHDNSFGTLFGIVLLPNTESVDIANNGFEPYDFDEDGYDDGDVYSGLTVLPVGIADIQGLIREADSLDIYFDISAVSEMDPEFQEIHDLLTAHLAFPEEDNLVSDLSVESNDFYDCYVGAAFAGTAESIDVKHNFFEDSTICGALETGFPGALLGQLLDLVIDSGIISSEGHKKAVDGAFGASAVQAAVAGHTFPNYDSFVTYKGNIFYDNMVGAAVGFNAGALFAGEAIPAREDFLPTKHFIPIGERNRFDGNTCGLLLANGPGEVTVRQNDFGWNDIAIADLGYRLAYDAALLYLLGEDYEESEFGPIIADLDEIVDDFEAASRSTLLVESCNFELRDGEGIWILNDRVRTNIRQNRFIKALGDGGPAPEPLSAKGISPEIMLPGSTAIRVGVNFANPESDATVQCVPERVSITENTFEVEDFLRIAASGTKGETMVPASFVLFDLADASQGEFDLHLNRFMNLDLISGDEYSTAVAVLGDDEIDGSRNLWREGEEGEVIASEDKVLEFVVGPLEVSPLLTDEVIDKDEDLDHTASGDVLIYTGSAEGADFEVEVASGDQESLILKPVTEEEAQSAFTDEELEGLSGIFYLPLDIRVTDGAEVSENLTFRFENIQGVTNEELVVKTTTSNGVVTWDPANAYVSEDGQWIILVVGPDTTPSINDFTGSVTVTASNRQDSAGSGDGCQVGCAPISALLLLLPLMGLKRR